MHLLGLHYTPEVHSALVDRLPLDLLDLDEAHPGASRLLECRSPSVTAVLVYHLSDLLQHFNVGYVN